MKRIALICIAALLAGSFNLCSSFAYASDGADAGFRPVMRQNFDNINIDTAFSGTSGSYELTDDLSIWQYNYTSAKTENNALHISRTPADGESFTAKYTTLSYSGSGVDCYHEGRLGRGLHLVFEADVIPMQTDVNFMPLSIAHANTKASTIDFVKFNSKGQILFLSKSIGTYTAGVRYSIKLEFDLQNDLVSLWINGENTALNQSFTVQEGFKTQNIYSLRMSFEAVSGKAADFYVDNIFLGQYLRPESDEVVTVEPGGEYSTISAALSAIRTTGGMVLVKKGNYEEDVTVSISGSDFDKLDIVGEEGAVLNGSITVSAAVNVAIHGLTLDGGAVPLYTDEEYDYINASRSSLTSEEIAAYRNRETAYESDGIIIKGRGCEVTDCTIRNFLGTAINIGGADAYIAGNTISNCSGAINTADRALIENNIIDTINVFGSNCGSGDVFRVFGKNITIRNNYYKGTDKENLYRPLPGSPNDYYAHADFIQSYDDTAQESAYILIEGNVFIGFCHQGMMLENDKYGASKGIFYIHDWVVRNNVFSGFGSWGVCAGKVNGGIPGMVFYNNLFDGEKSYYGLAMKGLNGSGTAYNNIFIGKGILADDGTEITSNNNAFFAATITGDVTDRNSLYFNSASEAGFVSYTAGKSDAWNDFNDLHIMKTSPLVDMGTETDLQTDIEGNDRSCLSATDIGPYEYSETEIPASVSISFPKDGYALRLGSTLRIEYTGENVTLCADGLEISSEWTPQYAGIYTLNASNGQRSDEITVTVYPADLWESASSSVNSDGICTISVYDCVPELRVYGVVYRDDTIDEIIIKDFESVQSGCKYEAFKIADGDCAEVFIWDDMLSPFAKAVILRRN